MFCGHGNRPRGRGEGYSSKYKMKVIHFIFPLLHGRGRKKEERLTSFLFYRPRIHQEHDTPPSVYNSYCLVVLSFVDQKNGPHPRVRLGPDGGKPKIKIFNTTRKPLSRTQDDPSTTSGKLFPYGIKNMFLCLVPDL